MSDYYGQPALESWLGEEVFFMKVVPYFAVMQFEKYREGVERDIEAWLESDDGEGNSLSWRGWGRGFNTVAQTPDDEIEFGALVEKLKEEIFEKRRVLCAANELPDGHLILGARHWDDLMHTNFNLYLKAKGVKEEQVLGGRVRQGFVDQWGNFLNREVAWMIAEKQGQIRHTGPGFKGPELYSENLY